MPCAIAVMQTLWVSAIVAEKVAVAYHRDTASASLLESLPGSAFGDICIRRPGESDQAISAFSFDQVWGISATSGGSLTRVGQFTIWQKKVQFCETATAP